MNLARNRNVYSKKKYLFPILVGLIFIIFFVLVTTRYISQAREYNDEQIAQQIELLNKIFERINNSCKITGFRHEKNYIDFLNVKNFEGSQVGPMNLIYPAKWDGPYLENNITIQGKEYQIISNKLGYFIIPGDGVKLANGKIIGRTLVIGYESNIEQLMHNPEELFSKVAERPLAAHVEIYSDNNIQI